MRDGGGVVRLAAAAVLLAGVGLVALIAAGAFDPRPLGPLVRSDTLEPRALAARGEASFALPDPFDGNWPDHTSIHLTAAFAEGELDSGYGLTAGGLTVAVSPLGYVAIWEQGDDGAPVYYLPWQTWPHARPGAATNEIWLDIEQDGGPTRVTAWLNRERLWQGNLAAPVTNASLWLGSFGGPVRVDFQSVEWYEL